MNKTLEELAVISYGRDYKDNPKGNSIPIYGTGGIMGYTSLKLNSGPAILSGRKGSINNPLFVENDFWNVDTIFCVKPKEGIDPKWLFYNFRNNDLTKLNEATGVPSVSARNLYKISFKYFDFPQQKKIAQILSTCDSVLEKTEAAIAKYQALKQGLMHDLFTRGIDVGTGQLRSSYKDAPDLYKETKLGFVPKEWEVQTVDKVAYLRHGYQFRDYDFTKEGIDVVKIGQVGKEGNIDLKRSSKIDPKRYDEFKNIQLSNGDILMALTGATLGKTAIIRNNTKRLVQNYRVGYFEPKNHEYLNKNYLYYLLIGESVQNEILGFVNAGAQGNIGKADFEKILVTIPQQIKEQRLVAKRLLGIDKKIQTEQQSLAKFTQIKAGLMQDLLSGKVGVEGLVNETKKI